MKKPLIVLIFACFTLPSVWTQEAPQKYALVIGNGSYSNLSRLANPVNDANDIAGVLEELGFTVDKVLNGNLENMEAAVTRLKDKLSASGESAAAAYGFFFYAGHGVQSNGENFLIPVDANIPSESYLRNRSLSVQIVLDDLNEAHNSLNVVVLDACRDNPFGWGRSGNRGLAMVSRQPAGSIIVYATSAGQQASDGIERNGLFTSQLLNNLTDQSLEVKEVFNRTGADVSEVSNNQQIPAIYSQFFGTAYLGGGVHEAAVRARPTTRPLPSLPAPGSSGSADRSKLWTIGASVGTSFAAPWVVGTVHGTIAPFRNSFLELGFDVGMVPATADTKYYSLYPFAHYAFFLPLGRAGLYTGVGGGLMIVSYQLDEGQWSENIAVAAFTAGVNLFDMVDVSWTLRTNFSGMSQKISAGYTYRF